MTKRVAKVTFQEVPEAEIAGEGYHAKHEDVEKVTANPDSIPDSAAYWAVDEATKEVGARVRLMLEKSKQVLTQQQYNAFVLVDLKKLKLREAARVMELTYARVDQLVKKARLKLQKVYEETENYV